MLIKAPRDYKAADITPQADYIDRRRFMRGMGAISALASLAAPMLRAGEPATLAGRGAQITDIRKRPYDGEALSSYQEGTGYALFREFGEGPEAALKNSVALQTRPWTVSVEGECLKPRRYDIAELMKLAPIEERVYRHRCVDGWYMIIPWLGYSLNELIRRAEPTGNAKFVEFTTHFDPAYMHNPTYPWPYVEGLRMDEAMHPLTLLTFGLYGEILANAKGAPLRLVVPWKIAHKSIKSLVKIRFVEQQPRAHFFTLYPQFYGFYRNVHPGQWQQKSQARERRISEWLRSRETKMLNGYAEQVAHLYGSELDTLR